MVGGSTGLFGDPDAQVTHALSVTLINSSVHQAGFGRKPSFDLSLPSASPVNRYFYVVSSEKWHNAWISIRHECSNNNNLKCFGMARCWALGPRDLWWKIALPKCHIFPPVSESMLRLWSSAQLLHQPQNKAAEVHGVFRSPASPWLWETSRYGGYGARRSSLNPRVDFLKHCNLTVKQLHVWEKAELVLVLGGCVLDGTWKEALINPWALENLADRTL